MTDEHNDSLPPELLDAWDVPAPSPGLTDRILARNGDAISDLRASSLDAAVPIDPAPLEASPMHPTDSARSLRPFLTTALIAAAAAAALLVAFVAGRSTKPDAIEPTVPNVRIEVAAPSPSAPNAAARPSEELDRMRKVIEEAHASGRKARSFPEGALEETNRQRTPRRNPRPTSSDLKNPFADDDAPSSPFIDGRAPMTDPAVTQKGELPLQAADILAVTKEPGFQKVMPNVIGCVTGTGTWRVKLEFVLTRSGSVVRVRQLNDALSNRDWTCAEKALRKAKFKGTGKTEIRDITLSFESNVKDGVADDPPKPKQKTSKLRIGTNPGTPPAEVRVDGKRVGTTPLARVEVTPGRHKIEFRWPDGKRTLKFVNVQDGGTAVVRGG